MSTPPVALTIAGSDSGGGAGIQADLRCFAALGVHGACAVTAVTAQDTVGVQAIHEVPPDITDAQIAAVLEDLKPRAVKTGMLASVATLEVVAARAATPGFPPLVVDPVLVSSSGRRLVEGEAELAYLSLLFPLATVVTPNLAEAAILVARPISTPDDMAEAARQIQRRTGAAVVVVKGGHLAGPEALDVVFDGRCTTWLSEPRVATANLHGTGCTFSAAITAYMASGQAPPEAITRAKAYVSAAIRGAARWSLGSGQGPLDHLGWGQARAARQR
ncbi:MAG: bifunctional hydroxymethylpyrimidine kinase/phosphomethylpyrimidine kinase [Acidimicrobiales bacterium]